MNIAKKIFSVLTFCIIASNGIFANSTDEELEFKRKNLLLTNSWGFSCSQITRIQLQNDRSNFVWHDDLLGVYYQIQTENLPINFTAKLDICYPFANSFNSVPQVSKQVIVYAFALNIGPIWAIPVMESFTINLSPIINFRYQLDDFFHRFDLGAGGLVTFEFPLFKNFTVLLNGGFSYDFVNLGTNKNIRNYNHVWTYNVALGFRISKKVPNDFYYFGRKEK